MLTQEATLERTLANARQALLDARVDGHWEGYLSSSALSTATAVCALDRAGGHDELVRKGIAWLAAHPNADGGYGDTTDSPSNVSTTTLCWAILGKLERGPAFSGAEAWLRKEMGDLTPPRIADVICRRYGVDRTFSVPILTMCALAGRFGEGPEAWRSIPRLPFELAALPRSWFPVLGLPVVSYALPALIALGQCRDRHRPGFHPLGWMARGRTLRVLEAIQPSSGGFLEAIPITSFVAMSLEDHPVRRKAIEFLARSARADGSWPIEVSLATWVTTLAVQALGEAPPGVREWLLGQQTKAEHPYTGAAPGAWAWNDLPGGVPDADDTPGALLALSLMTPDDEIRAAAQRGVKWLLDLQNRDGGIPTFCRGWGKMPFDRSSPDLTAHAIRAWRAWNADAAAIDRAIAYLVGSQRPDGSWVTLWFGNQHAPNQENPVYGTSRVLKCPGLPATSLDRGRAWLAAAQNADGGWGSIEETAVAVEALAPSEAASRGARWLVERTAEGTRFDPAPIGLYFAKLWYSERLYPIIFTVAALRRALA